MPRRARCVCAAFCQRGRAERASRYSSSSVVASVTRGFSFSFSHRRQTERATDRAREIMSNGVTKAPPNIRRYTNRVGGDCLQLMAACCWPGQSLEVKHRNVTSFGFWFENSLSCPVLCEDIMLCREGGGGRKRKQEGQ